MSESVNRFKWARENLKKMNVQTVAKELEIPRSLIDEIESDNPKKRGVSYLTVKKLADYYGVSMDWICGEDLPLEEWSIKKDVRIATEYTGLSSIAIESLNRLNTDKTHSSSGTLESFTARKMLNAYNFFLSNSEAAMILAQIYEYIFASFGMCFRQPGADANSIYSFTRETFGKYYDLFFSSEIQFLIESDQKEDTMLYSFGLSESDYANVMLERIIDGLKQLRKELKDLEREKIRKIIKSSEKKEEQDLDDNEVPE